MPRGLTHAHAGAKKGGTLVLIGVLVVFGYAIYLNAVEEDEVDEVYTLFYLMCAVLLLIGLWYVAYKVGWKIFERCIKTIDRAATYYERRFPQKKPYRLVTVSR